MTRRGRSAGEVTGAGYPTSRRRGRTLSSGRDVTGRSPRVCEDTGLQPSPEVQPRAMFERLFGGQTADPAIADRIPPGQYRTEKFPVLHYGSVPHVDLSTWDLKVYGEVDAPFTLTWEQFKELPRKQVHTDIHCVTRWSKLDTTWEGVAIQTILELAQVRPSATHVVSHAEQGYTANVPLSVLDDEDVLLADTFDGQPLEPEHGFPLRLLIPKKYFWKSSKWIRGLEFLDHDQLGFWERYGYNNDADPWKEERYSE
jgi:DMSO/TMAO reductase YedYZ molybdopterin-dependent catalytic subunit